MMNIGKTVIGAILAIGTLTMTSCNTIDDDLSDCGKDYRIDYVIRMVSNPDAAWQALLGNGNSNSFALSFHKAATGELVKSSTLQNQPAHTRDRKSTRLNSSHANISYAVFCLK